MCGAKEMRIWGLAEGAGLQEMVGESGAELEEAPPKVSFQHPSHGIP